MKSFTTHEKLSILSQESQYDLSCACGTKSNSDHRKKTADNQWLYPVSLPNGGTSVILKTLLSNACVNDCIYCPLRSDRDIPRCTLQPHEVVNAFLDYYRKKEVFGLFVSSGVIHSPDATMERINAIGSLLRKRDGFKGYLHLKIIPGASDGAIEEAVRLASAVSINIEAPGERHFSTLCKKKNYLNDIIRPIKLIQKLTSGVPSRNRVHQTTQFIVGAAQEADREIVQYTEGLYRRLDMHRVYFSAYQREKPHTDLLETFSQNHTDLLTREHRLYQVDWLLRKYGFSSNEIPFERDGNLSLNKDPKTAWAESHPEFFPVNINRASKYELLRVPGIGPIMVNRILDQRKFRTIHALTDISVMNKRLNNALRYVRFS